MGILHDFECDSGHTFEQFVKASDTSVPCQEPGCKKSARRVYLQAPKLDWAGMAQGSNAGPEFIDRFEKIHRKETARQDKILREHGDYGPGYAPPPSVQGT